MSEEFQKLLEQLDGLSSETAALAKALPAEGGEDDEAIRAAADEGAEGDTNPEDEDEEEGDDKPMTKSIQIGDEEVEVVDAEQLLKSVQAIESRLGDAEGNLAKSMNSVLALVKGQNELIKSLQGQVAKLAGTGAGRKTMLTVHEKPAEEPLKKSQGDEGMTVQEFLVKSHAAFDAKKITGKELTMLDVAARSGQLAAMDQALIAKVVSQ